MCDNRDAATNISEDAKNEMKMKGVKFIVLEEISDPFEEQASEEEEDMNEREELRKRLPRAEAGLREERKLYDDMFVREQEIKRLRYETMKDNKYLSNRVKKLQQQEANLRQERHLRWEREDEEALRQGREETFLKSQAVIRRELVQEKEIRELREENEALTVELDRFSLGQKYKGELQNLRRAEAEFKHKLEEAQEVLHSKDEEIEKISMSLIQKHSEIGEHKSSIEALRLDQQNLKQQLSNRQVEQLLHKSDSNKVEPSCTSAETKEPTESVFGWCAKVLWKGLKVAGTIALCVLLPVGIMASMVPVCHCYDLWDMALDLLEPFSELCYTVPLVY